MKARYTKRLSARLIAALLFVLLAAGSLPGCAAPAETEDDGRMKVVTTIFPQYDFVRAIGGDLVHLRMLLSPGEEMHSYEPTPLDIKEIQNCDLFIYVGGENDVWVDRILDNMGDHRPETLRLVDLTDTVEEEIVEGMMEERGHEHDHDEADHHEDGDHDEEVDHHEDDDHDEDADHETVDDRDGRSLGRGEDAAVDAAEDDDRDHEPPERRAEGFQPLAPGGALPGGDDSLFVDLDHNNHNQRKAHHDARHDTGHEHLADRYAGDGGVNDEGDGRRNDDRN